jgi:hypothetical protein
MVVLAGHGEDNLNADIMYRNRRSHRHSSQTVTGANYDLAQPAMFSSWSSPPSRPPSPRPTHHINASRSSFANPWPQSWLPTSLLRNPFVRAEPFDRPDIEPTRTVTPDWERYEERLDDGLRFTWLGHAVCIHTVRRIDHGI